MNFSKRTYRKARQKALNDVYSYLDMYDEFTRKGFFRLAEETQEMYSEAIMKASRIVKRGRREKNLWAV